MRFITIRNDDGDTNVVEHDVADEKEMADKLVAMYGSKVETVATFDDIESDTNYWNENAVMVIRGELFVPPKPAAPTKVVVANLRVHEDWGGTESGLGFEFVRWEMYMGHDVSVYVSFDSEGKKTRWEAVLHNPRVTVERDVRDKDNHRVDYAAVSKDVPLEYATELLATPRREVLRQFQDELKGVRYMPTDMTKLHESERQYWKPIPPSQHC